jgi:hypothetical protein
MKLRGERKSPEEIVLIKSKLERMRQENKESAQRQRDKVQELKEVKEQLKANLAQAGRDLIPLLMLLTRDDKRKAKKAKGDLDKLFLATKLSDFMESRARRSYREGNHILKMTFIYSLPSITISRIDVMMVW